MVRSTYLFFFLFSSFGGWGKIKLKLTTLPRIFTRVVYRIYHYAYARQTKVNRKKETKKSKEDKGKENKDKKAKKQKSKEKKGQERV